MKIGASVGDNGFLFKLVTSSGQTHALNENRPLTLACGTEFHVEVSTAVHDSSATLISCEYLNGLRTICTVAHGRNVLRVNADRSVPCRGMIVTQAAFVIIGQSASGALSDQKMTENKGPVSPFPSYNLFVETCDDDPICYPVVDRRVEVPSGVCIRFTTTSDVESCTLEVRDVLYRENGKGRRWRPGLPYKVAHSVVVATLELTVLERGGFGLVLPPVDVTIVPVPNDRSGAAAPVADVQVDVPLGKATESIHLATPCPKTYKTVLADSAKCIRDQEKRDVPLEKMYEQMATLRSHTPACGDAEGVLGKRFIPPWNKEERACEECFLTRVTDPSGWRAVTGSSACNYTPMRVRLTRADDDVPFCVNEDGEWLIPYGTQVMAKTDRGDISNVIAGDLYRDVNVPFTFEPDRCLTWKAIVRVVFSDPLRSGDFKFCLRTDETEEELEPIWEQTRLQNAIHNATDTLNRERESLERTWEKIQVTQDKLAELKVEQAKLAK
jgi:hypothetical protein